jgi:hypothetical protein
MLLCFGAAAMLLWVQSYRQPRLQSQAAQFEAADADAALEILPEPDGGNSPVAVTASVNQVASPEPFSVEGDRPQSSASPRRFSQRQRSGIGGSRLGALSQLALSSFGARSAVSSDQFVPAVVGLEPALAAVPEQISQLVVDLSDRQVHLYRGPERDRSYDIAIGQDGWETPVGRFQVTDLQVNPHWEHPITKQDIPPGPDNPLGTRWIAFWSDGKGIVGFHGTYDIDLIGQAVSHGCIRMRNEDVEEMYDFLSLGVPVIVRP